MMNTIAVRFKKLTTGQMKELTGGGGGHKRISDVAPVLIGGFMVGRLTVGCTTDADCPTIANCSSVAGQCDSQGCLYIQCV